MPTPSLVVIDVQREYVTPGRPYCIRGIDPSLANARVVLAFARNNHWEIIHVRHLQDGDLFGKTSPYSDYAEGFEPQRGEMEITKNNYSCYSSDDFARLMHERKERPVYVIGYGSTKCCLATIVEGHHRGQKMLFVADASNAKRSERFDEDALHKHATDILSSFSTVVSTQEVVAGHC